MVLFVSEKKDIASSVPVDAVLKTRTACLCNSDSSGSVQNPLCLKTSREVTAYQSWSQVLSVGNNMIRVCEGCCPLAYTHGQNDENHFCA